MIMITILIFKEGEFMALKYSRQREAIKDFLSTRKDHPTADTVYMEVRKEFPNISLGTVYRNLTLLADIGEICRVNVGDGIDHFDPDTSGHIHFLCNQCGCVQDLEIKNEWDAGAVQAPGFAGEITGSVTYYYGLCEACKKGVAD